MIQLIYISYAYGLMDKVTGSDPVDGSSILPKRAIYLMFSMAGYKRISL